MKKMITLFALFLSPLAFGAETSLDKKLDDLNIPDDQVTPVLSQDNFYIVNTRYSSLINRHEIGVQGSHNLTADSHLDVKQISGSYRYHLNSKWSFGLRYNHYSNKLTQAGQRLLDDQKIVPDQDFAYNSQEIFATYNTIYGKLRWSSETVVYFDQFISVGGGQIELASGKSNHALVDLGLAFWIKKHGSMRVGVRNELYNQVKLSGENLKYNAMGYIEFGFLFGDGDRV
ncbi:MAG: outer membrane beta-barrel protein [Bacteriovoracaceae bacterium]|jgi:outer membrane beta-barrel protein